MPQSNTAVPPHALPFRTALIVWAILLFVWSAALATQQDWAKALWIWPQAAPLNHVFVASIGAAIAAPLLWIGLSGQVGAVLGGVLNLLLLSAGGAWTLFGDPTFATDARLRTYAWIFVGAIPLLLGIGLYARRFPLAGDKPMPALVRWSFAAFCVVLILVGGALVLGAPHVFPWPLKPTASALYGWVFLGAAIYFLYGFLHPCCANACGQLLGFLAYDLVLLGPYIVHLGKVLPEHRASLIVYLAVILYSAGLAIWYLTIHGTTCLRHRAGPER